MESFQITVTLDGIEIVVGCDPRSKVEEVIEQALDAYGVKENPRRCALQHFSRLYFFPDRLDSSLNDARLSLMLPM